MKIWQANVTAELLNERARGSFSELLGIYYTDLGDDFLVAEMTIEEKHLQPMGIMHGGVTASLAETVASAAANYCIDNTKQLGVGLDLNINHIRAVKKGDRLIAICKAYHLGRRTQVWEIKITNEKKKLVSASRLTLSVISWETLS